MSTKPCPHCGSQVPEAARFCGQCGRTIETVVAPSPAGSGQLMKTVFDPQPYGADPLDQPTPVGTAPPGARGEIKTPMVPKMDDDDEPQDEVTKIGGSLVQTLAHLEKEEAARKAAIPTPAAGPSPLNKTMMLGGEVPPAPTPAAGAPPAPAPAAVISGGSITPQGSDKRTMLGMPARDLPPPQQAPAPSPAHKTMLGVAMPGIAPSHPPAPQPHAQQHHAPHAPQQPPQEPPRPMDLRSKQGTILGAAAVPGMAPAQPTPQPFASSGAPVPPPAPYYEEPLPEAPQLPQKRGVPAVLLVVILIAIVLAGGAVGAFFLIRAPHTLAAQPQLDETGKESLRIKCESCPDGTVLTLGASSATVQAGASVLPLPAPLSIGDNDLVVKVDRPAGGRDEEVKVRVPVAYRVRADLTTLAGKSPAITVRVEATRGTEVTVEGKPVALDDTGRGSYAIDVAGETHGASDEQKVIERKIPFSITPKGGRTESGQLTARAAVVPLHLDAPGAELYTERSNAPVTGQTKPGGSITIDGHSVEVDAQGRFAVRVELPSPGEKIIEILAASPPLAPRLVRSKIVRVASLADTAKELEAKTPLAHSAFAADPIKNVGKDVVVDGEVLESRTSSGHTILVVDEKKACASPGNCLVRVVHGEDLKAVRGDGIRIFGHVAGTVSWQGKTLPDIESVLALPRGAGK